MLEFLLKQASKKLKISPPDFSESHCADEDILFYVQEKGVPSNRILKELLTDEELELLKGRINFLEHRFNLSQNE